MRPVCVLWRLGSREMAWIGRVVLRPVWACIWHCVGTLWGRLHRLFFWALGLVTRLRLPAPEERGERGVEAEGDGAPETVEEPSHGAAGMKRAAASQEDFARKRTKYEEEEEEKEEKKREEEEEKEEEKKGEEEKEEEEYGGVDSDDEFYCDYDSTWEDERAGRRSGRLKPRRGPRSYNFRTFERAAEDMQNFRHGYPNQAQKISQDGMPNLMFYLGKEAAKPDGFFISEFHSVWKGQYGDLESVHTFIQWLFPLQEPGVNHRALPLTPQEVQEFRKSDEAKENLLKSYELMLDFYGIELCNKTTGEVRRSPKWKDRFHNLNRNTHNNLRITRILKCLGTLGFQHYQVPLVRFFLEETLVKGELPRVKESVLHYFVFAVLDRRERRKLIRFAFSKYDGDEFVWCPKKIQQRWLQNEGNVQGGDCDFVRPLEEFKPNTEVQDDRDEDEPESLY